jgi:uroporphyrinogen-III synthase
VARFFAAQPQGAQWPRRLRAASPGPGSAAALRDAGVMQVVEPTADAAQLDSEALWRVLEGEEWRGARVLVVRGDGGRDWLADQLRARGADVRFVQAYRRALPVLDASARALLDAAADAPAAHLWLFSSSQAVDHLVRLAPAVQWRSSSALATHPRIAAHARRLGFGLVREIAPALDAVAAAVQHGPLQSPAE